jgi:hypothetical protein
VQHQRLTIGFDDRPRQAIAIFHRDLVSKEKGTNRDQGNYKEKFNVAQHDCLRLQKKLVTTSEPRVAMNVEREAEGRRLPPTRTLNEDVD